VIAQRLGPQPARRDEIRELAALLGWDKQA